MSSIEKEVENHIVDESHRLMFKELVERLKEQNEFLVKMLDEKNELLVERLRRKDEIVRLMDEKLKEKEEKFEAMLKLHMQASGIMTSRGVFEFVLRQLQFQRGLTGKRFNASEVCVRCSV